MSDKDRNVGWDAQCDANPRNERENERQQELLDFNYSGETTFCYFLKISRCNRDSKFRFRRTVSQRKVLLQLGCW